MGSSPIQVATFASVAQSVEQRTENPRVVGSIPTGGTIYYADLAHLVERHLAKVEVASSSLVIRSKGRLKSLSVLNFSKSNMAPWPSGKAEACKAFIPSSNLGGASKKIQGCDFLGFFNVFSKIPKVINHNY